MSSLPLKVLTDILSRLPIKSLARFRCVSKSWCALIDGPDFIKTHIKRSVGTSSNLRIILRNYYLYSVDFDSLDYAVELDHPLKCPELGTEILGSCNGLLCLYNSEEDIVLWNPLTGKYHKLPVSNIEFHGGFAIFQFIVYGFGFDYLTGDYKVLRIVQFYGETDDSFHTEVKVYSLKSNSWRRIRNNPYYLRYSRAYGILCGGGLHWVVSRESDPDSENMIVAFDLGSEDYREVPQPEYLDYSFHLNVGVLGGSLCMLCNYHRICVDVWVMKQYGVKESWSKLFSITQAEVGRSFEYLRPLVYSKSGCEVLLEQDKEKLFWYDLKGKRVLNVNIHGLPNVSYEAVICVGSLVTLSEDWAIDGPKKLEEEKKKRRKKKRIKNSKRDDFLYGFSPVL